VRPDAASSFYRVAVDVSYIEGASPAAMRRALEDCYGEALAELDRRFGDQDNRRQQAGGERR
jgi:hypothetical protein